MAMEGTDIGDKRNQSPRILVSKLRQIGDTVLWTSALISLRQAFPNARIEAMVPKVGHEVLVNHPAVDEIHRVTSERFALPKLIWKLRKNRYDYYFGFHANTSLVRLARWIRAKEKILHHHSWLFSPKLNTREVPHPGKLEHVIQRDHRLLEAIGLTTTNPLPKIWITDEEKKSIRELLAQRGVEPSQKIYSLLPGARVSTRRYPEDLWKRFAEQLTGLIPDGKLVAILDPGQSKAWNLEFFCKENGIALLNDLSLRQVLAVLSVSEAAVGNDSGLIHAAAALGAKTLSLYGAGCFGDFSPSQTGKNHFVRVKVDCRGEGPREDDLFQYCTLDECSHHSCMRKIEPEALALSSQEIFQS